MLRNVCIAPLHNTMLCSAMLRRLCFVLVLRCALLHYGTWYVCYAILFYVTLFMFCYVSNITFAMLCYFLLPSLHCLTLRHGRLLHYGMRCYVTICYITLPFICAVFLGVVD